MFASTAERVVGTGNQAVGACQRVRMRGEEGFSTNDLSCDQTYMREDIICENIVALQNV